MTQLGGYPVHLGGLSTNTAWPTNFVWNASPWFVQEGKNIDDAAAEIKKAYGKIKSPVGVPDKKENEPMKYYRVLQNTADFEAGAVLYNYSSDYYKVTEDSTMFLTDAAEKALDNGHSVIVRPEVVENSPTWFERVYPINGKDTIIYGTKAEAQATVSGTSATTSASA